MTSLKREGLVTIARLDYREGVGPARRRNAAILAARTPWVWLLDADADPEPDCLTRLLAAAQGRARVGAVSPRVAGPGAGALIQFDGGRVHFLGELCLENGDKPLADDPPAEVWVDGAASTALLVRREAALEAGLFDPRLVIYRDDLDFCLRLRQKGWRIAHCSRAVVRHDRARLERGPRDLGRRRAYYQARNRWRLLLGRYETRTLLATLPLQLIYEALNFARAAAEGTARQCLEAYADVLASWPQLRAPRCAVGAPLDARLLRSPPLAWRRERLSRRWERAAKRAFDAVCRGYWGLIQRLL